MSKLTNAEKDKLDNTCGNLRVTKLGTHVKSLEDFVNESKLDTTSNNVADAINELYAMLVNKDCEGITIPPPGFFTLFGNDDDGKLYCYYNNADHPPQFQHIETPGELEGTLYLCIAGPNGDNSYQVEVGHYIAVKHLDDYYTKTQCNSKYAIKNHAVDADTYGKGTASAFGHLKVANNLDTTSTDAIALAAAQGKVLKELVDAKIENAGTGLSKIGKTLNHSNSVNPQTSSLLKKITFDGQGHITGVANVNASDLPAHDHGRITGEGKIGTEPNIPLITGAGGLIQAGAFGTGQNNFARGNHAHSQYATITYVDEQIALIDPGHAITVVDYVRDGNMNAVTSNAVYDYTENIVNTILSIVDNDLSGITAYVDELLSTKQNEVETQSRITQFTNKDRINISRLLDYMENGSGDNYYKLILKGAGVYTVLNNRIIDMLSQQEVPCVYSANDKLATVTKSDTVTYSQYNVFAAMLYKNGQAQTSSTATITFKLIDGTVLGTSNTKLGTNVTSGDDTLENYTYLSLENNLSAGIYYVYAEVTIGGSVIRSNILSVFVKDTNNLLTHNQWSAGDYEQATNGLINASGYQVQLSNQWSHIGENSFKITRIGDSGTWAQCNAYTNKKELTASCSILAGNGCGLRVILYYTDDTTIFESVTIPASNNIQTPSVNIVADSTKTVSTVALRINNISSNSFVYVDNIKIF